MKSAYYGLVFVAGLSIGLLRSQPSPGRCVRIGFGADGRISSISTGAGIVMTNGFISGTQPVDADRRPVGPVTHEYATTFIVSPE